MSHRAVPATSHARHCRTLALLAGMLLLAASPSAFAVQSLACDASPATATVVLPPVSIVPNQSNGLIGSPGTVQVSFNCKDAFFNTNHFSDDFTLITGNLAPFDINVIPPGGIGGIMFKTNLPGVELQLTAAQNQAGTGGGGPNGMPGWEIGSIACSGTTSNWECQPFSVQATFTAQLVKTGTIAPGTVNSINLLQFFDRDYYCSRYRTRYWGYQCTGHAQATPSPAFGTLILSPVNVSVSGCSVAVDPTVVTLPTVFSSNFSGTGSTVGQTPFDVRLNCLAGANLSITLATNASAPGLANIGVIKPTAGNGFAKRIGVQILDGSGNPVSFGNAIPVGATTNGSFSIPFQARYYQTGNNVSGGQVSATATYTLTYQ